MATTRDMTATRTGGIDATSLRSTIDGLWKLGELLETAVPVDPDLELAGIQKRLDGGPVLLFNQVKGFKHARFLVNLFSDRTRIDRIFGYSGPQERKRRFAKAFRNPLPPVVVDQDDAPVQEVVLTDHLDVNGIIPPIRHTKMEQEPTIGSGVSLVAGRFFDGGTHVGYNRMNFRWGNVSTFQTAPGSHVFMVCQQWYGKERIPLTMNFGLPPAATLAAGGGFDYVVLPFGCDELGVAGGIQGSPIRLVKAATIDEAYALADAEYVLEGYLDPTDRRWETAQAEASQEQGKHPFHPEWAGYMGRAYRAPTFHVTAITHRRFESRPLLQPMIVHSAEENNIQTAVREAALFDLAERIQPGLVRDVNIPFCLTDWGGAIFQVKKRNPVEEGYQRNVLVSALAMSRGMRLAIAVDTDIDIYNMDDVMWAITTRLNPATGLLNPVPGGAGQTFQPSERVTAGGRQPTQSNTRFEGGLAIDATIPFGAEAHFERPRYPVSDVDLTQWFSADDVAKAEAQQQGWVRMLAKLGW